MEAEARWLNVVTCRAGLIKPPREDPFSSEDEMKAAVRFSVARWLWATRGGREKVLAALKRAGGSGTAGTVARSVSAKGGTVRRVLEKLVGVGVLSAVVSKLRGRGRPTVKYFFRGDGVGQGRS